MCLSAELEFGVVGIYQSTRSTRSWVSSLPLGSAAFRLATLARKVIPDAELHEIMVIATQRSGSNHFCDMLGNLTRATVLNEIFNRRGAYGVKGHLLENLGERLGQNFASNLDKDLTAFFRTNPQQALDFLSDFAKSLKSQILAYKIFQDNLPIRDVLELLSKRRPFVVFLVRSRLSTYVSLLKVKQTKKWSQQDTTNLVVEVDPDSFLIWAQQIDSWYDQTYEFAVSNHIPFLVVFYESDVDIDENSATRKLINNLSVLGINSRSKRFFRKQRYFKQDKNPDPFRSIADGEGLRARFIERSILDYALRQPLDGQPASLSELSRT